MQKGPKKGLETRLEPMAPNDNIKGSYCIKYTTECWMEGCGDENGPKRYQMLSLGPFKLVSFFFNYHFLLLNNIL
jgi:hypothetical protein